MLFKARFIEPILSGQKITTWRLTSPAFKVGDIIPCQSTGMKVFARVRVKAIRQCVLKIGSRTASQDGFRSEKEMLRFCLEQWGVVIWSTPLWKVTFELVEAL